MTVHTGIRGIRDSLNPGTIIGRMPGSSGAAQEIPLAALAKSISSSVPSGSLVGQIGNGMVLANISGAANTPVGNTLTAVIDSVLGSAQGDILYRDAAAWKVLAPGTAGHALTTGGAGANPAWSPGAVGTVTSVSVVAANGFSGSVATATTTPAITITTSITASILAGNGTALSAASLTSAHIFVGSAGNLPVDVALSGDATLANTGALTLATVATAGTTGSSTAIPVITIDAKGRTTGITTAAVVAPVSTLTGAGTGVLTALAVNVGSAGAFVTFNGAGGTPSSMTATNLSGTAASLTSGHVTTNANLTGHVTSVGNAAVLGSFTSAQLATALTDELGTGKAIFGTATTWTPADASGAGLSLTVATAEYTQIGNIVFYQFRVTYPVTVSAATAAISGLPVNSVGDAPATIYSNDGTGVSGFVANGGTSMSFAALNGSAVKTNAQLSGATLRVTGFYFTS